MQYAKTLSRDEMRNIKAGGGNCRIYVKDAGAGPGWSTGRCLSVENAQDFYNEFDDVTGYCCASCGTDGFSNATPC